MANIFVDLPATAGNGTGAGVDTTALGKTKTITVQDPFTGTVTIEISLDAGATWAQLCSFTSPGQKVIDSAAEQMRVRRAGFVSGSAPNVDVGANDNGALFTTLNVPAGAGTGTTANTSTLGVFKSISVIGAFSGIITLEISEDGSDWAQVASFNSQGLQHLSFTSQFARVRRAGSNITGTPVVAIGAINDSTSSFAGGGAGSNSLIYQPGGTSVGPVVFNSWTDLMTQLTTLRANANSSGTYTVRFDDSVTSPAVIPAGGPYDMTNVTWEGGDVVTTVNLEDDAFFTNLRRITHNLTVVNLNTTTAADTSIANGDIVLVDQNCRVRTLDVGVPLWSGATLADGESYTVIAHRTVGIGSIAEGADDGPVFGLPVTNTTLNGLFGVNVTVARNFLDGAAGAIFSFQEIASSARVATVLTFGTGGGTVTNAGKPSQARFLLNPYLTDAPATAPVANPNFNDFIQFDVSGGGVSQVLPDIDVTDELSQPGAWFGVKEVSGSYGLEVTSFDGGQTIDGSGNPVVIPPNGAALFVCDGISNWMMVGLFKTYRYTPNEMWFQDNVPANQTNVALGARVSGQFTNWKASASGSIVRLVTRFTEAITTSNANVTATINGSAANATLTHTSVSNATGGIFNQNIGLDTFDPNDLLGIRISTGATFAPTTTDLEAYLVVEENFVIL